MKKLITLTVLILIALGMQAQNVSRYRILSGNNSISAWMVPEFDASNVQTIGQPQFTIKYPADPAITVGSPMSIAPGSWVKGSTGTYNGNKFQVFFLQSASFIDLDAGTPIELFEVSVEGCTVGSIEIYDNSGNDPGGSINWDNTWEVFYSNPIPQFIDMVYDANPVYDVNNYQLECLTLPVELLSFEGVQEDCREIRLEWKARSDMMDHSFYLERAIGPARGFNTVAEIEGSPDPEEFSSYSYLDTEVPGYISSGPIYYRLKHEDQNGFVSYSKLLAVPYECVRDRSLSIYPNPTADKVMIDVGKLGLEENSVLLVEFRDVTGKKALSREFTLNGKVDRLNVDVKEVLIPGMYTCRILVDGREIKTEKLSVSN